MGFDLAGKAADKRVRQNSRMIVTARIRREGTTLAHRSVAAAKKRRCYSSMDLLGLSKVTGKPEDLLIDLNQILFVEAAAHLQRNLLSLSRVQ
jgi:hypothetical protein